MKSDLFDVLVYINTITGALFYLMMANQVCDQAYKQRMSNSKGQKQLINFKHLLKLQILKKQKGVNQSFELRSMAELRASEQKNKSSNMLMKKPLQVKIQHQNISSDCKIYIPSKNSNILIFPFLNNNDEKQINPKYATNRLQFFHKIRGLSIKKSKEDSYPYKRRQRKMKSRYSSLNFAQKVDCRTITPLEDDGLSQRQLLSRRDQLRISNKLHQQKRSSSRYQDIPVSEFIYDSNGMPQKEGIQAKYQSKLIKICRRKSMSKKQIPLKN